MAAIITSKFRIHNAQQFQEAFSEASPTAMYLGIGRPQGWTDDNSPDTPTDAVSEEFYYWDDMVALKKVQASDVTLAIPRRNWEEQKYYDIYRDDYNGTTQGVNIDSGGATTPSNLFDSNFYVITDEFNVYKCIYNGDGRQSLTKPTGTGTSTIVITESDGIDTWEYRWKYMYTVSPADVLKFVSTDFIPVKSIGTNPGSTDPYYTQYQVEQASVDGRIDHITVTNGGSGYTSAPTVTIIGDGTGATATATIDVGTGQVTGVEITAGGTGYTYATMTFTSGGGANAAAQAIISPKGGHGSDAVEELGGYYVMMNVRLEYDDGAGDFPIDNDYRRIMLVRDPLNFGTSSIASQATRTATFEMEYDALNGSIALDRTFTNASGAVGYIVSHDSANSKIRYSLIRNYNTEGVAFGTSETITMNDAAGNPTAVTWNSVALTDPEAQPDSGDVIYVENRRPINRADDQIEDIKIIVEM